MRGAGLQDARSLPVDKVLGGSSGWACRGGDRQASRSSGCCCCWKEKQLKRCDRDRDLEETCLRPLDRESAGHFQSSCFLVDLSIVSEWSDLPNMSSIVIVGGRKVFFGSVQKE